MKRKINLVGQSTLTVSLPSKWAQKYGLKKGDEVEVSENGSVLEFHGKAGLTLNKFSIKVDRGNHSYLRAIISNVYKKGYDEIEIIYEKEDLTSEIQKIVDTLLGLEMMDVDAKHCVLKNVATGLDSEFDNMVRKIFQLILQNNQKTYDAVKNNDFKEYNNINYVRFMVTKYSDFCKRTLNKHHRNDDSLIFRYMLVQILEKASNKYDYIYKFGAEAKPKKFSKECLSFFKETNDLFELFFHAYYSKDKSKIKVINLKKDKLLFELLYDIRNKVTPDDLIVIHYLATIVRKIVDLTGPFFALTAE
ncbi:AbrB/MazE/SpoVT family DNA-binding domain-containing protein [Candidatus Woesearchaeota archaeon]|nr:AbrB/MazE/SpoVT family DNA-binding domain-containing protein [Candidatus Woesearchaeota archaeon]